MLLAPKIVHCALFKWGLVNADSITRKWRQPQNVMLQSWQGLKKKQMAASLQEPHNFMVHFLFMASLKFKPGGQFFLTAGWTQEAGRKQQVWGSLTKCGWWWYVLLEKCPLYLFCRWLPPLQFPSLQLTSQPQIDLVNHPVSLQVTQIPQGLASFSLGGQRPAITGTAFRAAPGQGL